MNQDRYQDTTLIEEQESSFTFVNNLLIFYDEDEDKANINLWCTLPGDITRLCQWWPENKQTFYKDLNKIFKLFNERLRLSDFKLSRTAQ